MGILKNLDNFNYLYSYNIFAFNGLTIIITRLFFMYYYYVNYKKYGLGSWLAAASWLKFTIGCFIFAIFIIAFIVWLLEQAFQFKINNINFMNNIIIKILRHFCALISFSYLIITLIVLITIFRH